MPMTKGKAQKLAAELTAAEEEGWSYEAVLFVPEEDFWDVVVRDEEGLFVAYWDSSYKWPKGAVRKLNEMIWKFEEQGV